MVERQSRTIKTCLLSYLKGSDRLGDVDEGKLEPAIGLEPMTC